MTTLGELNEGSSILTEVVCLSAAEPGMPLDAKSAQDELDKKASLVSGQQLDTDKFNGMSFEQAFSLDNILLSAALSGAMNNI